MSYSHSDSFKKTNHSQRNYSQLYNGKDKDEYVPKVYGKKTKVHNEMFNIHIPEYELDKERQRQKREMDRRRPKNRKYMSEY